MTRIGRHPRRATVMVPASAIIVLVAGLVAVQSNGPARATSGGSPYAVPAVTDTNPDPDIVETTIVADEETVDIGNGVMANVLAFNGAVPGPEFRFKVGDTAIVYFKNRSSHPTGIHWHGIEYANASDGSPLTQNQVPPGGTFLYKFKLPRPGIYWYHPHHHSSTNQVFKGLYGPIVVTDPYEADLQDAGAIPPASQTVTLALSDTTVCKSPGSNDEVTYDPSLPWVGGGPLPAQPPFSPTPKDLCEGRLDPEGNPITHPVDEDGNPRGPYAAGDVPNIQHVSSPAGPRQNEGQTVLTNGKNVGGRAGSPEAPGALAAGASTLDVKAGQGIRLRIGDTATTRFFRLRLTDSGGDQIPLVRIGGQGGLLDRAVVEGGVTASGFDTKYGSGEILLDPGDRADVVAAIPATATGVLTLWTQDFQRLGDGGFGQAFARIPTVPVMHLNVTGRANSTYTISNGTPLRASVPGASVETLGPATGRLLNPKAFSPDKPGMANQDIRVTAGLLAINGVVGSHDHAHGDYTTTPRPGSTRYAKLGDTLELTFTNESGAHHPFHLHGFSIQPLRLTELDLTKPGAPPKPGSPTYTFPHEFKDNIDVPAGYSLRFRVRLDERPLMDGTTPGGALGRWVFHCHIFYHATGGMISELVVVAPNGNERPYVNARAASAEYQGGTATMTGTYMDPDGDAVTLTGPSLGTFTDNGDGTWSWRYRTTDVPDRQLLYVTATDARGHKDQIAFELDPATEPDRFEPNDSRELGTATELVFDRHAPARDPRIFEHYGGLAYDQVLWWTEELDLTLHDDLDEDWFRALLPNPGTVYPDVDPDPGVTEPLPECDTLTRHAMQFTSSQPPNPPDTITVNGVLRVGVRTASPAIAGLLLYAGSAGAEQEIAENPIACPIMRDLPSLLLQISHRLPPGPALRYHLDLRYELLIQRVPGVADWLRRIIEVNQIDRSVFPLLCPGGGAFPDCAVSPFKRFEIAHPVSPRPGCEADGPGCPMYHPFSWPGTAALDLRFRAPPGFSFELLSATGKQLAKALPARLVLAPGLTTTPISAAAEPLDSRLFVEDLPAGFYVLRVNGPEATYELGFQPPPPAPDTDGDGLADPFDPCPAAAEDVDGFRDADGCPDRLIAVGVDVMPGNPTNPVNPGKGGVVRVAILTGSGFDAATVDTSTVCFGDAEEPAERDCTPAKPSPQRRDVDGDGDNDLLLFFEVAQTGIDAGDTSACLHGATLNSEEIRGCDAIRTPPRNPRKQTGP